jgi:hypothetical protein
LFVEGTGNNASQASLLSGLFFSTSKCLLVVKKKLISNPVVEKNRSLLCWNKKIYFITILNAIYLYSNKLMTYLLGSVSFF